MDCNLAILLSSKAVPGQAGNAPSTACGRPYVSPLESRHFSRPALRMGFRLRAHPLAAAAAPASPVQQT